MGVGLICLYLAPLSFDICVAETFSGYQSSSDSEIESIYDPSAGFIYINANDVSANDIQITVILMEFML